jgi:hypothetical protein
VSSSWGSCSLLPDCAVSNFKGAYLKQFYTDINCHKQ